MFLLLFSPLLPKLVLCVPLIDQLLLRAQELHTTVVRYLLPQQRVRLAVCDHEHRQHSVEVKAAEAIALLLRQGFHRRVRLQSAAALMENDKAENIILERVPWHDLLLPKVVEDLRDVVVRVFDRAGRDTMGQFCHLLGTQWLD